MPTERVLNYVYFRTETQFKGSLTRPCIIKVEKSLYQVKEVKMERTERKTAPFLPPYPSRRRQVHHLCTERKSVGAQ